MEQTSDLLNTGSHMETGTTADQEYMWSVVDLYEQMAGKSLGNGKARAGVTIGHLRRLWTFKKARKLGYKLHSPWLVRHPISVIFFLTFRFEEKKIILDIVWHFWQLSWMWWYSGSLSSCVNLHITTWKSC